MNKLLVVFLALVIVSCSVINGSDSAKNISLNNLFIKDDCPEEDFGSNIELSSQNGYDIDFYFFKKCKTVDLFLRNLGTSEYKCSVKSLSYSSTFIIHPGEVFTSTIPRKKQEDSFLYNCYIYNMLPTLASWNTDFIYRVKEGVKEFQYYNDKEYAQTCSFFSDSDEHIIKDIHIKALSWSQWRNSHGLDINGLDCQPVIKKL